MRRGVAGYPESGDWLGQNQVSYFGRDWRRSGFVDLGSSYDLSLANSLPDRHDHFQTEAIASNSVHAAAGAVRWNYDRAELIADGVVHGVGVLSGLVAATVLIVLTAVYATRARCRGCFGLCRGPAGDAGAVGDL